jgi:hypothetical protein
VSQSVEVEAVASRLFPPTAGQASIPSLPPSSTFDSIDAEQLNRITPPCLPPRAEMLAARPTMKMISRRTMQSL